MPMGEDRKSLEQRGKKKTSLVAPVINIGNFAHSQEAIIHHYHQSTACATSYAHLTGSENGASRNPEVSGCIREAVQCKWLLVLLGLSPSEYTGGSLKIFIVHY